MKSKWLSRVLFVSAGIIFGLICGMILASRSIITATDFVSMSYRAWEANQAMNAYLNDNPETARYALTHYADILSSFSGDKNKDGFSAATAQDLAFTYIRLGKIAKAGTLSSEAEQFYDRGYVIYKQYCIDAAKEVPSREKLIDLINKLDAQAKPTAISFSNAV